MRRILTCLYGLMLAGVIVAVDVQGADILNNERLRFGNGAVDSVNNTGNLQGPQYYNPTLAQWRNLTIANNALVYIVAEGGDGTNGWNNNLGERKDNPVLAGQVIDTSGFTAYDEGTKGYGTIISVGTTDVNGKTLEIRNTYYLPQNKSYIRVTTHFRNVSGVAMSNLRYWIGTQDDWLGATDMPRKEKGNLVGGVFVQIADQDTKAKTLRVTCADEGVVFHTDSDKANTLVAGLGMNNIFNKDPVTSAIDTTSDNSYAFYVRLNDLADGATDQFEWYYIAGPASELADIVADVDGGVAALVGGGRSSPPHPVTGNSTQYFQTWRNRIEQLIQERIN
ncbi:MAG: hypothetical protein JXN60_09610 [Lentisphaerae bacterium]|nr:hypothetical protein [Lentisphaerota bacterium]